jgi:transcriptional regulator with XRE-family HTH domain
MARRANPTDLYVGRSIRACRLAAGMSQGALANSLGLSFQQIQKYEKGTARVAAGRLQNIATALGVDVSTFFKVPEVDEAKASDIDRIISALTTPDGLRIARALPKLSGPVRKLVTHLIEAMAEEKVSRKGAGDDRRDL